MSDNWIVANFENAFSTWNDKMTEIYTICGGIVEQIAGSLGGIGGASVTLPAAIEQAVEDTDFWASIPLWLVTILGSLFFGLPTRQFICSVAAVGTAVGI